MRTIFVLSLLVSALIDVPSVWAACTDGAAAAGSRRSRAPCAASPKFVPHDPDRVRPGSRQGFIDIGGGTEVRIGGRARMEYQVTR